MSKETGKFLSEKNVVIGLDANSKEDAIFQLSKVMQNNGIISDTKMFTEDVLYRESLTTTGVGNNIAIPHGKSDAVNTASFVFAKVAKPLEWNSLDGNKVTIIFLMAVRENDNENEHLKMLAHISGNLADDVFVEKIKKENDPKKLVEIFEINQEEDL